MRHSMCDTWRLTSPSYVSTSEWKSDELDGPGLSAPRLSQHFRSPAPVPVHLLRCPEGQRRLALRPRFFLLARRGRRPDGLLQDASKEGAPLRMTPRIRDTRSVSLSASESDFSGLRRGLSLPTVEYSALGYVVTPTHAMPPDLRKGRNRKVGVAVKNSAGRVVTPAVVSFRWPRCCHGGRWLHDCIPGSACPAVGRGSHRVIHGSRSASCPIGGSSRSPRRCIRDRSSVPGPTLAWSCISSH